MKKLFFLVWISLQFVFFVRGQTACTNVAAFSMPSLQLRPAAPELLPPTRNPSPSPDALEAEATMRAQAKDLEVMAKFERALVPIPPSLESRTGFDRVAAEIFEPEVFHIGHVAIGSSLSTAIRRKNPLCLLNPYVFWASW